MRSEQYEQALTRQGIAFSYHEQIDLEDIDLGKGLRNQARLEAPLDEELVTTYLAAVQDKAQFPPVVLWRPGRGRWIAIDGNNRLEAYRRAGKKYTDALVVEHNDPQVIDRLTWRFNNLVNGKRLSQEESLQHAISYVLKYGYPVGKAAEEWGVPKWRVQRGQQVSRLRDKLREKDARLADKLDDERIHSLAPIERAGEDLFLKAAGVVAASGVFVKECDQLSADVGRARSVEDKGKVIEAFANSDLVKTRKAETKGGRVSQPRSKPNEQLKALVHRIILLHANYPQRESLMAAPVDYKAAREEALDVVRILSRVYDIRAMPVEERRA